MAGQEDAESKRLLKPGDVRVALRPTGYFAALDATEKSIFKSSFGHSSGSSFQPLVKPSRSLTPTEPHFSHFYIRPTESHHYMSFSTQPKDNLQKPESSGTNLLSDRRHILKSESETTLRSVFPRGGGSNAPFEFSTPSSPESEDGLAYRKVYERQGTIRRHPPNFFQSVSTQTERSPFEEKFLFRESILLGCDLVSNLAQRFPHLGEVREWTDFVREKTIQSRTQNVCSRMTHKAKELQILTEYIKTFFRIADSWLDVRSCFGTSDQCLNETCCLDTRELTANYTEWMHVSRHLLNSIAKCLESVTKSKDLKKPQNVNSATDSMSLGEFVSKSADQLLSPLPPRTTTDLIGSGGIWGYPPNPPCCCGINPSPSPSEQPARSRTFPINENSRFPGQPLQNFPPRQRTYSDNESTDTSDDYLTPSSYDVPRANMSTSQRRQNISKAKSTCFKVKSIDTGIIIEIPNSANNKGDLNFYDKEIKDSSDGEEQPKANEGIEAADLTLMPQDEWLFSQLKHKDETKDMVKDTDIEDNCQDSDSQGSTREQKADQERGHNRSGKETKLGKVPTRHSKRRLSHQDLLRIQDIVQALWKCDIPDHIKHPVKNTQQYYKIVKHPIFLETITNKTKNGVYETLEQFVHDCRRLILNASMYCQKENSELEKVPKLSSKFENLLEDNFEQYESWTHIFGDPKEMNYYPELRYTNTAKKRSKLPKNQTNSEVTHYNKS